jgi:3-phenylpropionate/cinnamic acid dioxygenase small subunit
MSAGSWESYHAITSLMFHYAECIDRADFAALGRLFTHGQIRSTATEPTRGMRGEAAVRDFYAQTNKVHADGTLRTRHLNTNIRADIDDVAGVATVRSSYLVLQATARLAFQPIVAGRYDDRFERHDGAWRFADRLIHVDQIGDVSEHLAIDLAAMIDARPKS